MTKEEIKQAFAIECTETNSKGVIVVKGTPMDIINWINDKLDQETQRLKAELEKVKAELEKKINIPSDQYCDNLLRTYNADKSNK